MAALVLGKPEAFVSKSRMELLAKVDALFQSTIETVHQLKYDEALRAIKAQKVASYGIKEGEESVATLEKYYASYILQEDYPILYAESLLKKESLYSLALKVRSNYLEGLQLIREKEKNRIAYKERIRAAKTFDELAQIEHEIAATIWDEKR